MDKIRINLKDILLCFTNAQGIISPILSAHHQQVAYLSYRLAEELGLESWEKEEIFFAALIHDIGALSYEERMSIIEDEYGDMGLHGLRGAKLFEDFKPLKRAAAIIKYHHQPWNNGAGRRCGGQEVPMAGQIIHLADRICIRLLPGNNVLTRLPHELSFAQDNKNTAFVPEYVDALCTLGMREYIWLELMDRDAINFLPQEITNICSLEMEDLISITQIFSHIIDFKSSFTYRHSAGVARVAERLAQMVGFSPKECKMMLIAGYLHDIGKLAISNDILDKPSKLDPGEFDQMRSHTYYTYRLLAGIPQFEEIKTWASFHHEKLDGTGYPFRLQGDNLSLGSRIMAVADVFTAITEDRPYRQGMDMGQAVKVLRNMSGVALDPMLVELTIKEFDGITAIREKAQKEADDYYKSFLEI